MNQSQLSERLWDLAARVGKVVDALPETKLGRHVASQLVRCGTSAAPNYDESGAAESRDDFVHKLSVALKELRETRGWLRFIIKAGLLTQKKASSVLEECEQLCRVLGKSVLTAKSGRTTVRSDERFPIPDARFQDSLFKGLDHIAVVVPDTDAALKLWRDRCQFPVLFSEVVNQGAVRLTHLDLGNTHLQLVQPLAAGHPLQDWLRTSGPGLHHFCLRVDDVSVAMGEAEKLDLPTAPKPHQGTQGRRAVFLDNSGTQGVRVELTGK
jgi:methylmalonyl-CoA/ethylmalonyl-CoA epimerase